MYPEVFNNFMKKIKSFMKVQGFTSKGNNFYKRHSQGNIGIINFQRNKDRIPKFTINIGIYSLVLAEFFLTKFNQRKVTKYPLLGDYHWDTRVGSLVPREHSVRQKDEFWLQVGDKWWWYDENTDINQLFQEINKLILDYGIPEIDNHLTDQQLMNMWLASAKSTKKSMEKEVGELRAATERARVQILRDLSILLLAYGEKEKFHLMMAEFGEYLNCHPQFTGLKEDYDKLLTEPTFTTIKSRPEVFNVL